MKRKIVFLICILLFAGAAGYLAYSISLEKKTQTLDQAYEEIQKKAEKPVEPALGEEQPEAEQYVSPIDFDALWKMNQDIYAWIEIPGADITYPIVQHNTEDDYYLFHTVENESGYPGSIYTQTINKKDFSRYNTVIYGHNMRNGTMFSNLIQYADEAYFEDHRDIYIYTPTEKRTYRVFAAVLFDDRLITSAFNDDVPSDREQYLDEIFSIRNLQSHFADDIEVTPDDHIITLSTCWKRYPDSRYLIEAVLVNEEK